nr:immunoglobulin light chain junction region [Macaca mulatta]
CLQGDCTPFTF